MAIGKNWIRTEIKEIIVYIAIGLLLTVILPMIGGFILKGFESELQAGTFDISSYLGKFIIYFFLMIGAFFLIIFPVARIILIPKTEHPANQKKANWFTIFTISLIDAPEENGALYRLFNWMGFGNKTNPMKWSLSLFRCLMISCIIFGGLGMLQIIYPTLNISGVPQTSQQLTTTSDIIFGSAVPSFSENGVLCLIFFFLLGVVAYICSKLKLGIVGFFIIGFVFVCPLMGFTWASFHNIVYGNSDAQWTATFIFGWIGSSITLATGIFIFWLAWHFFNNLFVKLASLIVVKEDILFVAFLIWISFTMLYIFIDFFLRPYLKRKFGIKDEIVYIPQ